MMVLSLKNITLTLIVLSFVLVPLFLNAQDGLVPCDNSPGNPCDYPALIKMIEGILNWVILISGSLSAIAFAYAGFLYLTKGSNPEMRKKAKDIFTKVLIGFIIVLSAWLIVQAVLTGLGFDKSISPLGD